MVSMLYKLTDHLLSLQAPSWRGRGDPWRGDCASSPPSSASGCSGPRPDLLEAPHHRLWWHLCSSIILKMSQTLSITTYVKKWKLNKVNSYRKSFKRHKGKQGSSVIFSQRLLTGWHLHKGFVRRRRIFKDIEGENGFDVDKPTHCQPLPGWQTLPVVPPLKVVSLFIDCFNSTHSIVKCVPANSIVFNDKYPKYQTCPGRLCLLTFGRWWLLAKMQCPHLLPLHRKLRNGVKKSH